MNMSGRNSQRQFWFYEITSNHGEKKKFAQGIIKFLAIISWWIVGELKIALQIEVKIDCMTTVM